MQSDLDQGQLLVKSARRVGVDVRIHPYRADDIWVRAPASCDTIAQQLRLNKASVLLALQTEGFPIDDLPIAPAQEDHGRGGDHDLHYHPVNGGLVSHGWTDAQAERLTELRVRRFAELDEMDTLKHYEAILEPDGRVRIPDGELATRLGYSTPAGFVGTSLWTWVTEGSVLPVKAALALAKSMPGIRVKVREDIGIHSVKQGPVYFEVYFTTDADSIRAEFVFAVHRPVEATVSTVDLLALPADGSLVAAQMK